jgi:hypothetical protein
MRSVNGWHISWLLIFRQQPVPQVLHKAARLARQRKRLECLVLQKVQKLILENTLRGHLLQETVDTDEALVLFVPRPTEIDSTAGLKARCIHDVDALQRIFKCGFGGEEW